MVEMPTIEEPVKVVNGDAATILPELPDRSVSLWVTSPPYEGQRTYGIGFSMVGQTWVDWIRPIIREMCRTCSGLVVVNMSSPVRDWSYWPAVEWLVADLTRLDGVVCGPSPFAWVKSQNHDEADGNGIPGSGSKHYQRRDWEPLYAFAYPDRLPGKGRKFWSDNTAYGKPPFYGAGGEFSNRNGNGTRANDPWKTQSRGGMGIGGRRKDGSKQQGSKSVPAHSPGTNRGADGKRKVNDRIQRSGGRIGGTSAQEYDPPCISNPGNVIRAPVGGNKLGCSIAHDGEAPMSRFVVDRFVSWYAEPDGIVGDPFCGTGTTGDSARTLGRRFWGCDVRQSQVELTWERMARVTPSLFDQPR